MNKKILIILALLLFAGGVAYAEMGDIFSIHNSAYTDVLRMTGSETLIVNAKVSGMIVRVEQDFDTATAADSTSLINGTASAFRVDSMTYSNTVPTMATAGGTIPILQPDFPRTVNIVIYTYGNATIASSASTTGAIGIYGIDAKGNSTYESIVLGVASANSTTTRVSNRAWARITRIYSDTELARLCAYTDTLTMGFGPSLGLTNDVYNDTMIAIVINGVNQFTSTSGNVSGGTVDAGFDTFKPTSALAGQRIKLIYKANIKGNSE